MKTVQSFSFVLLFLILMTAFLSLFVVEQTQRAIVLRLGKMEVDDKGQVGLLGPGLHWKIPLIDSVKYFVVFVYRSDRMDCVFCETRVLLDSPSRRLVR